MSKISNSCLKNLIELELPNTKYLNKILNIKDMLIRQCFKESSYNIHCERYESHINDTSVGIYQLLMGTMEWLGFEADSIFAYYYPENQVKYALEYLDFQYSKFPEIHNKDERVKFMFSAYNMGRKNINKALEQCRQNEDILYEGKATIQGKWATYDKMIEIAEDYSIVSSKNVDINKRYIKYITEEV